tara:strand:+ start:509 stop:3475 length:2967 start_codon:yes stop_codon:yes gene_type:complete
MESITLLDCNAKQSSQFLGGNTNSPALFTNKLGSGIKVEAGDKVSVHNCFISEIGADANAIQITDEFLENKSFTYTKITNHVQVNGSNDKILGYERQTASNITTTEEIKTNKFSILINYYKNNNGENHFNLPRLFEHKTNPNLYTDWEEYSSIEYGQMNGSYNLITTFNASYNGSKMSGYYVDEDVFYFDVFNRGENKGLRPKNNNSRFKIFIAEDTRYGSQSDATLDPLVNASFHSPCLLNYLEYIEKIDIEVPAGFKSPDEIADDITRQLTAQSQPQINYIRSNANYNANASLSTDRSLNVEINSPTYHTFYASSPFTSNKDKYNAWVSRVNGSDSYNASSNHYLSQYQYIGVKRPELWMRGREWASFYKDYLNVKFPGQVDYISDATFTPMDELNASQFWRTSTEPNAHTIELDLEWDRNILEKLNAIFMEQRNHPELFTNKYNQLNGYTNVNNSRFLHINALSELDVINNASAYTITLGNDYMLPNASGIRYLQSVPLFFDFNPTYENIYTEGLSWEEGYSFGCFKKYYIGNDAYVSITTSHLGIIEDNDLNASFTTIPNNLWAVNRNGSSTNTKLLRARMGWDVHFNSYGNVCIGLTDGYVDKAKNVAELRLQLPTGFNTTQLDSYNYVQKIYLGANEPKLQYNNTSNRFELSDLHTSERIQNRNDAGGVAKDDKHTEQIVPEFPSAGEKVYKVNKRLFDTNWTTAMMPYKSNRITDLSVQGQDYQVDFLNPNLSPWTIYDQLSGIIIKDFGYSQSKWNNGFWGRLGFEYNQFNSSRSSTNDLTNRVGNSNKNALPYAITNADVGQTATMDFTTNIFGAGLYSLQLPITMSFNASNHGVNQTLYFRDALLFENYPAISESATSVKLTAPNLPRKLINPYFCIRSDILDSSDYIGGADSGELYPVIAVVPKVSDYPDFFVNTAPDMEFVFTKPKTITSITTSIHDPSQALAQVNDSSAVIYKITKQIPDTQFNIINQILNNKNK